MGWGPELNKKRKKTSGVPASTLVPHFRTRQDVSSKPYTPTTEPPAILSAVPSPAKMACTFKLWPQINFSIKVFRARYAGPVMRKVTNRPSKLASDPHPSRGLPDSRGNFVVWLSHSTAMMWKETSDQVSWDPLTCLTRFLLWIF